MKNSFVLVLFGLISLAVLSCKETEEEKRQKAVELMTTQTLGLAYLEELKLDEAEREFQKYIGLAPGDKLGYANLGLVFLRMGKYPEAQKQLEKARDIDPKDPDVSLLLATVHHMKGDKDKAISLLEEALLGSPDHPKVLFDLSALYSADPSEDAAPKRQKYLEQLEKSTSGNLVPVILLTESYIKLGEKDKAISLLERLPAEFPAFPKESLPYYDQTLDLLREGKLEDALLSFTVFHNYQKVTFPYQSGMTDLKGPGESAIGFPLITYNEQAVMPGGENTAILDVLKFTEVTASTGLEMVPVSAVSAGEDRVDPVYLAVADFDGDGDSDVYVAAYDPATGAHRNYLFQNELGRYHDVAPSVGISKAGKVRSASFADYDNDGYLDLYVQQQEGNALYRNADMGQFDERAQGSGLFTDLGMRHALFADLDHDGDLDLLETGKGTNKAFRNNGDGTFEERSEAMGLKGLEDAFGGKSAFGDFDDDGDLDLVVLNEGAAVTLFSNERQGVFRDITDSSGLSGLKGSNAVAVGDYDNDGFLDLLLGNSDGLATLLKNDGKGGFQPSDAMKNTGLDGLDIRDVEFVDFDNDGYLDILVGGIPGKENTPGLHLYHNGAEGMFMEVNHLLPERPGSVSQIAVFDYNEDGDMDLLLAGSSGGVYLLRNDGGNMNHYLNMKLVGLRTGSAKNNFFGIGAKVEMRAGDLYQSRVVTDPNIYFGLGSRSKADVIRITWTNGVPQNILLPEADQALVEEQVLKGSCPFLYTWNGQRYEFVKDITWRSALGMPLGIMGGNTMYAFADASDDYIRIPGEMLREEDGTYRIQVTSELWETIYMDRIRLVAVDHPDSVEVFVPEQFSPPPFPGMDLRQVRGQWAPVTAWDDKGRDRLELITAKDDQYVSGFKPGVYQGLTELHHLVLDPGQQADPENLQLYLRGWIFPTDASINTAMSQSEMFRLVPPSVQVMDEEGSWRTVIPQMGFPMGKDKTVIVDLSGKFLSEDLRVRISTNMEIYWDQAFFARADSRAPVKTSFMDPVRADLHYRGFSKSFRKGGPYGPHWFDYDEVSAEGKWRDLTGNYTRYGDVLPLLMASDNQYVISNAGDEISIDFHAAELPALPKGWKRDFLIHSVGWVKDGDMNTAHGNTVEPLPYHGMRSYPPAESEAYPAEVKLQQYREKYNTRRVAMEDYRNREIAND